MTVSDQSPRHRSDNQVVTPFTDLTDTLQTAAVGKRGVALASATGIVMTAAVTSVAAADPLPTTLPQAANDDFVSNLTATDSATLVSLDIDWEPGDEVAVVAEAPPEPEPEPVVEEASRDYVREDTGQAEGETAEAQYSAAPGARMGSVVETAFQFLGTPYVYGGSSPAGFDCSGLTSYVYALHGVSLPRTSQAQWGVGTGISLSEAQPGDLVIMNGGGHVGIYIGGGQVVHAPRPGRSVEVAPLSYMSVDSVRRI